MKYIESVNNTVCPIVLSAPGWDFSVQSSPKPRIVLRGVAPNRDELINCLMSINAPLWSLPVFEVLIELADKEPL